MGRTNKSLQRELERAQLQADIEATKLEIAQLSKFRNQWEVLDPNKSHRRNQPSPDRDTQEKQLLMTRNRLKAQAFARQMLRSAPVAKSIVQNMLLNIVGSGPKIQFMFDDPAAAKDYQEWFEFWAMNADATERFSWYDLYWLNVSEQLIVGENLCWWDEAEAKIQLFEGEQLKKVSDWKLDEDWQQVDGLAIDELNRIQMFAVSAIGAGDEVKLKNCTILQNEDCLYSRLPTRYTDFRGYPPLLCIASFLDDLRQLLILELQASKAASAYAMKIHKKQGGPTGQGRVKGGAASSPEQGGSYPQLEKLFGGNLVYLNADEDADIMNNNRPGPNIAAFSEFVTLLSGSAIGLPLSHTLLRTSTSYSAARNENNQAEVTYGTWDKRGERGFLGWSSRRAIQHAIDEGELKEFDGWQRKIKWQHEQRGDIDPLKSANARKIDLETYYRQLADFHSDWDARLKQAKIEEAQRRQIRTQNNGQGKKKR